MNQQHLPHDTLGPNAPKNTLVAAVPSAEQIRREAEVFTMLRSAGFSPSVAADALPTLVALHHQPLGPGQISSPTNMQSSAAPTVTSTGIPIPITTTTTSHLGPGAPATVATKQSTTQSSSHPTKADVPAQAPSTGPQINQPPSTTNQIQETSNKQPSGPLSPDGTYFTIGMRCCK